MNILCLSELFHPHGSGGELATYLYSNLLSQEGFSVSVVTNRFAGEPEISKEGNLTIYRIPLIREGRSSKFSVMQRFDVLFSSFLRKMVRQSDVVYIPGFWYSAIPLAKAYRKPVVVHLHGYTPLCPLSHTYVLSKKELCSLKSPFCSPKCIYFYERSNGRTFPEGLLSTVMNLPLRPYFANLARLSDALICVSKSQKNIMMRDVQLQSKLHVIYNPLPELSYIDIEGDDFGYFSGLNLIKGFDILCKALALTPGKISVHAARILGNNQNFPISLAKLGILPYGELRGKAYEEVYRRIRAVIYPSIGPECLPFTITEAILRGRLVIASDICGIPELLDQCKENFLFEPGNHKQLSDIMQLVAGFDREAVVDFGAHNREVIIKRFDNKKILHEFMNVLTMKQE